MVNLFKVEVKHLCYEKGWNDIKPKSPITLIIGSFNPFIPNNNFLPDYYYGRIPIRGPGNNLWSTIGKLKYNNKLNLIQLTCPELRATEKRKNTIQGLKRI